MAPGKNKRNQPKRAGGRRANYAPLAHTVGARQYFPYGWAMWVGWVMFGLLAVAMAAEVVAAGTDGYWADLLGAVLMAVLFGWMFWLFGITRLKSE